MKKLKILGLFSVVSALIMISAPAMALDWKFGADFMYGKKDLDSDWKPVDSFNEFGVMLSFTEADLPFGITAGYITGDDKNSITDYYDHDTSQSRQLTGKTEEFLLGIRKDFSPSASDSFRAYINGGYTAIKWSLETRVKYIDSGNIYSFETDDWAHGFWLGGGFYFLLSQNAVLGVDYKYTNASSDLDTSSLNSTLEAGGSHYSAFIGWRF
jgi:opacity protein-like surface antigen